MFLLCFRLSGSEINDENNNATISMIVKRNVKLVIAGYVGLSAEDWCVWKLKEYCEFVKKFLYKLIIGYRCNLVTVALVVFLNTRKSVIYHEQPFLQMGSDFSQIYYIFWRTLDPPLLSILPTDKL